jgi:formylglycine-generating enzyme required for sulfatase activity
MKLFLPALFIGLLGCGGEENKEEPHQMEWITVNAGTFVFGSKEDAPDKAAYSEDQSNVTLTRSFVMAQTEVTQHQWQQMGLELPPQFKEGDNLPVTFVNFYEAAAYCNALSKKEGLAECYDLSSCVGEFAGGGDLEHSLFVADSDYSSSSRET